MTPHEIEGMRNLWQSVAVMALKDHHRRISAARRGHSAVIDSIRHIVCSEAREIEQARMYFNSSDWREVCDLAGIGYRPDQALAFVSGGAASIVAARQKIVEAAA